MDSDLPPTSRRDVVQGVLALEPREHTLYRLPLSVEGFPLDGLHSGSPLLHEPLVCLVELDDGLCPVLPFEKVYQPLTGVPCICHQVGWVKLGVGATSFKQWGIVQAVKNSLEFLNNGRCLPNLGGDGKLGACHRKAHTFLWSGATGALYACGPVLFRTKEHIHNGRSRRNCQRRPQHDLALD